MRLCVATVESLSSADSDGCTCDSLDLSSVICVPPADKLFSFSAPFLDGEEP